MTSRRNVLPEEHVPDALDALIQCTLQAGAGQVQPPAYMWERIERQAQYRALARAGRRVLISVWHGIRRNLERRMNDETRWYGGSDGLYVPMAFSVWEGRVPLSLVCIIEQQMPILRLGWGT